MSSSKEKSRKSIFKKCFRFLFWTGLIFSILLLAGLSYVWWELQQPDTQIQLANKITQSLPEPYRHQVELHKIGGRLPNHLFIEKATFHAEQGDQIHLKGIELRWDWWQLFKRKLLIKSIEILELQGSLTQSEDGQWTPYLSSATPVTPPPAPTTDEPTELTLPPFDIEFQLETLQLKSIALDLNAKKESWKHLTFKLPQLNLNSQLEIIQQQLGASLNLDLQCQLALDDYPPLFFSLGSRVHLDHSSCLLELTQLNFRTPTSSLLFTSTFNAPLPLLELIQDPQTHLKSFVGEFHSQNSKLSLQDIQRFVPDLPLKKDIQFNLKLNLEQGKLATQLSINSSGQHVELTAELPKLDWNPELDPMSLSLKVKSLLEELVPEVMGNTVLDLQLSGIPLDLSSHQSKLSLKSQELSYKGQALPPLSLKTTLGSGQLTSSLNLQNQDLSSHLDIKVTLPQEGSLLALAPEQLDAKVQHQLHVPELRRLQPYFHSLELKDLPEMSGEFSTDLTVDGGMKYLVTDLSVQIDHVTLMGNALPENAYAKLNWQGNLLGLVDQASQLTPPVLTWSSNTLKQDLHEMGLYVHRVLQQVQLPKLLVGFSGNQLNPFVLAGELSLEHPTSEFINLKFSLKDALGKQHHLGIDTEVAQQQLSINVQPFKFNVQPYLDIQWHWLQQALNTSTPIHLTVDHEKGNMHWDGLTFGQDQWLKSRGQLNIDGPLKASFEFTPPSLEAITSANIVALPMNLSGNLKITSTLSGSWNRPQLKLNGAIDGLGLTMPDQPALHFDAFDFSLDQQSEPAPEINLAVHLTPSGQAPFHVQAKLPHQLEGEHFSPVFHEPLSFSVNIPEKEPWQLSFFQAFIGKELERLKGQLSLNINGQVPLDNPEGLSFKGKVDLVQVQGHIPSIKFDLDDLTVNLDLKENLVEFKRIFLKNKQGTVLITGSAQAPSVTEWHLPSWNANINADQWNPAFPPHVHSGLISAQITSSGNLFRHLAKGNIDIMDLLIKPQTDQLGGPSISGRDPDLMFVDELQSWDQIDKVIEQQPTKAPNALKTGEFDITVRLIRNNRIVHDSFKGELTGELKVKKDHLQDNIHPRGQVFLNRSVLKFQGHRFVMDKGNLNWDGDIIPGIDMTFKTEVKPYSISMGLQNLRADLVTPEFNSQPWLDNSDIISVLLIGRPIHAEGAGGEGSSGQDIAVSQGVSHLSKKMGLENMGVELEDVSSRGGTIRVGRYLHPRWYVSMAKAVGDDDQQEVSVEYLIRKNLKLKATQESDVPLGLDVEWSLDY